MTAKFVHDDVATPPWTLVLYPVQSNKFRGFPLSLRSLKSFQVKIGRSVVCTSSSWNFSSFPRLTSQDQLLNSCDKRDLVVAVLFLFHSFQKQISCGPVFFMGLSFLFPFSIAYMELDASCVEIEIKQQGVMVAQGAGFQCYHTMGKLSFQIGYIFADGGVGCMLHTDSRKKLNGSGSLDGLALLIFHALQFS